MSVVAALPEFQQNLIKKYLLSNMFKGCVSDVRAAKKELQSAQNINCVCNSGRYICIYGGLFGWGSKIKVVSFFSEDTFYYKDAQITTTRCHSADLATMVTKPWQTFLQAT